ncbi:zinc transporter ZIP3-like [Branchiostoma lanceolatum]|uniref:zinc transporter ZIP3-like n=1 Tax=Branchiostoma lanceolatum TaxID=7740 RepID=UPI00345717B2
MDPTGAKLVSLTAVLIGKLVFNLLPLKCMSRRSSGGDSEHTSSAGHHGRTVTFLNCFAGGVFLGTCFLGLLPTVRKKMSLLLEARNFNPDYPVAECVSVMGLLLSILVEQFVMTWRSYGQSTVFELSFHGHSHSTEEEGILEKPRNKSPSSPLQIQRHKPDGDSFSIRPYALLLGLSVHSVFEGLAIGLQDNVTLVLKIFAGIEIHECLVAFALGVNLVKHGMATKTIIKVAILFSSMIPLGIVIGMGVQSIKSFGGEVLGAVLQGFAGGTFLYVTFLEVLGQEFNSRDRKVAKVLFVATGFLLISILTYFLKNHV